MADERPTYGQLIRDALMDEAERTRLPEDKARDMVAKAMAKAGTHRDASDIPMPRGMGGGREGPEY